MKKEIILRELQFKAVRSSGPGGQNVNKVATKVILQFDLLNSNGLSEFEKDKLALKIKNRLTKEGVLILFCDESRSQHKNKELIISRFFDLVKEQLKPVKVRRNTKPTRSSVLKKSKNKKLHSEKKTLRKKPKF